MAPTSSTFLILILAVLFAVTGIYRALVVVTDIQNGHFNRLVVRPVDGLVLLLGLVIADFALVVGLKVPEIIMSFVAGVNFASGVHGILVGAVSGVGVVSVGLALAALMSRAAGCWATGAEESCTICPMTGGHRQVE